MKYIELQSLLARRKDRITSDSPPSASLMSRAMTCSFEPSLLSSFAFRLTFFPLELFKPGASSSLKCAIVSIEESKYNGESWEPRGRQHVGVKRGLRGHTRRLRALGAQQRRRFHRSLNKSDVSNGMIRVRGNSTDHDATRRASELSIEKVEQNVLLRTNKDHIDIVDDILRRSTAHWTIEHDRSRPSHLAEKVVEGETRKRGNRGTPLPVPLQYQ